MDFPHCTDARRAHEVITTPTHNRSNHYTPPSLPPPPSVSKTQTFLWNSRVYGACILLISGFRLVCLRDYSESRVCFILETELIAYLRAQFWGCNGAIHNLRVISRALLSEC